MFLPGVISVFMLEGVFQIRREKLVLFSLKYIFEEK